VARHFSGIASEAQPPGFEGDQIHETDGVVARKEARAFARIEDQRIAVLFVPMAMGMTVQHEVDLGHERGRGLLRIVDDENSPTGPLERTRRRSEIHSESAGFFLETSPFPIVVVAEDATHRNVEPGELFEHCGSRDVTGMDDTIDAGLAKEVHDSLHVACSIVGVADDANAHPTILPRRSFPLVQRDPAIVLWHARGSRHGVALGGA
jgi:hypothetical protein